MDNAKYHKGRHADTPKSRQSKACLIDVCRRYGIQVSGDEFKSILWSKLATHIEANVPPVIVSMARDRGHTVVFTPPHHSDLQPIEIVWANVKGDVGRLYTDMTKFPEVKKRLVKAFSKLSHHTIKGLYDLQKANYKSCTNISFRLMHMRRTKNLQQRAVPTVMIIQVRASSELTVLFSTSKNLYIFIK